MSDTPITDAAYDAVRAFTNEEQAVDALIELRETSRKLEQENAALREDKERLDLLNTLQWHGGAVTSPMMDGTCFRIQVGARPMVSGNTIRAAIDAARARKKA